MAEKTKIIVVVPKREFHPGFWSLGLSRPGKAVHFPTGKTQIEVTEEELAELKVDEEKGFLTLVQLSAGERFVSDEKPAPEPAKPPKK